MEICSLGETEMGDLEEFWKPIITEAGDDEVPLLDVLALGRVVRFQDDGSCYAWAMGERLGAFETDSAARDAVAAHVRAHLRRDGDG